MADLLTCQREVAAALRDAAASTRAKRWLAGDAALLTQRLAIYRANAAATATKALTASCPVLLQVVGDEFFGGLARAYLRDRPSTSGNLHDFGHDFADFLAEFPHAGSLPYLPDLARLEWLVHQAYGAADARPWDWAGLATVAPELHGRLRFVWAAGTALMHSDFPIANIWAIHQAGYAGEFAVDWSAAGHVMVAREGLAVRVCAVADGDAAFMAVALTGGTLEDAATAALGADPAFDLGALLARAFASNLICGIVDN